MRNYSVRRLAVALVAAGICVAGTASAADLGGGSIKDDPIVAPFSWTGFYIGANAGWGRADHDVTHTPTGSWYTTGAANAADAGTLVNLGSSSLSSNKFTGGLQAGYNWQSGAWLFGFETDINGLNSSEGSVATGTLAGNGTVATVSTNVEADWYGTLRGRLGFTSGNLLFYGTGGLAYGKHSVSQTAFFAATGTTAAGGASDTKAGWALGGGLEWAISRNWTFRGEYLHVDLGSVSATLVNPGFPTFTHQVESELKLDVIRAAINYKF